MLMKLSFIALVAKSFTTNHPNVRHSISNEDFFWKGAHFEECIRFFGNPITVCVKPLGEIQYTYMKHALLTQIQKKQV
jgi:hypothetical protein